MDRGGDSLRHATWPLRPLSFREIIDGSFWLYRENLSLFLGLSAVTHVPLFLLALLSLLFLESYKGGLGLGGFTIAFGALWGGTVIFFLLRFVSYGAGVAAVWKRLVGEETGFRAALGETAGARLSLVFCGVVSFFSAAVGSLFYLIPGFFAAVGFSMSMQSTLFDKRRYFQALGWSVRLAMPNAGKGVLLILFLVLVTVVGWINLIFARDLLFQAIRLLLNLDVGFFNKIPHQNLLLLCATLILVEPLKVAAFTLLYVDARIRSEALDLKYRIETMKRREG